MTVRRRIFVACSLLLGLAIFAVIGYMLLGGASVTLLDAVYMAVITLTGVGIRRGRENDTQYRASRV